MTASNKVFAKKYFLTPAESFSTAETLLSGNEENGSFLITNPKKTVKFGGVEIIKIENLKKYNKRVMKSLIQEKEEKNFDCQCNCILY